MAAGIGQSSKQPQVPAWKRIGLKLKFAKQDAVPHSPPTTNSEVTNGTLNKNQSSSERTKNDIKPSKKRKRTTETLVDSGSPDVPQKGVESSSPPRQRALPEEQASTAQAKQELQRYEHDTQTGTQVEPEIQSRVSQPFPERAAPTERSKSVTFASDSKQEDGLGTSRSVKQQHSEQLSNPTQSAATSEESVSKRAKKRQKRANGSKKSPSAKISGASDQAEAESVPEYLEYLQLFYSNKAAWKFNKNKQKDLLKNLFRLERIPAEHDEAILEYISGLQGNGPRQQLIDNAEGVLKAIAEKFNDFSGDLVMESGQARRDAYYAALRRQLERYERAKVGRDEYDDQQFEEMRQDAQRGKRAEAVLEAMLRKELYPEQTQSTAVEPPKSVEPNAGTNGTSHTQQTNGASSTAKNISKRKRRKARTQASGEDDSDSSSNSSSSNEDDPPSKRGPTTMHQALRPTSEPKFKPFSQHYSLPKSTGTKKIFDDELLDKMFPKKQSYNDTAPKRKAGDVSKARGFAYTHGTRADESGSEDE